MFFTWVLLLLPAFINDIQLCMSSCLSYSELETYFPPNNAPAMKHILNDEILGFRKTVQKVIENL